MQELLDRIKTRSASIGVVGLGYVGLPVAVTFAEGGFSVVGVDVDPDKVTAINEGRSYLRDVPDEAITEVARSGKLRAETSYDSLHEVDAVLISVPTPITKGAPDLSLIEEAGLNLVGVLKPGALVVLESTTYPGTTDEVLRPILESKGMKAGRDFLLAFSPERIDPANPSFDFGDIPKVVGGIDGPSTRTAAALYEQVLPKVFTVSGTKEAELSKLIENTFRHVNIALVNELAVYAHEMGIDIWEAIDAAATKPFGFMPFRPGPGWGGHCIPLDPSYLSWRVRQDRAHEVRFVELAQAINSEMPRFVVERVSALLNEAGKPIRGSRVLGVGIAYKSGTEDTRESAGIKILKQLKKRGAVVSYHDPLVPMADIEGETLRNVPLDDLAGYDLVVILVPQVNVDWKVIASEPQRVLDCCNALGATSEKIERL